MLGAHHYAWDFNVAYMEEGEKEFTYLQDELGSTIRLLEQGGESQAVYGYDEFGENTYNTQGRIQPFGYTGYRYDNVADTYFAQAREYVPGVGRFAGEDWIKRETYYTASLNQYGYCLGNSVDLVDYDRENPRVVLRFLRNNKGNLCEGMVRYAVCKLQINFDEYICIVVLENNYSLLLLYRRG